MSLNGDYEFNYKAAWTLELLARNHLGLFIEHSHTFFNLLREPSKGKETRPVTKIMEILTEEYLKLNKETKADFLRAGQLEKIISYCFQVLIGDFQVAPKAFAMSAIFNLREEFPWVKDELQAILEQDFHCQSAGYKARAKKILRKLNKSAL